jgi:serine/threonine-protein kinase
VTLEPCARCGRDHPPGPCLETDGAPGSLAPLPFDLLAGARVGEYQVTGLLGQGGMGVVYSGIHPLLGRKVAIKVLSQQMARRSEATARFLQEARAASTLHHQNIVDVFAFGELADGRYYQVMELLEGESLRSILNRRGPLNRLQARTIITGVLSGLGAAHRRGVVHRDIKPDNVFICGPLDGSLAAADIKILDFGLAKRESGADISIKTRTGVTMGTPAYMSPEQCRGIAAIDARTDIYASGVLLFEMISGRTPFQSESAFDLMVMQINVKPPRLARITGRTEPLEPIIMKALGKRPDERYGTASDMLAAINTALPPGAVTEELMPIIEVGPPTPVPTPRELAEHATLVAGAATPGMGATILTAATVRRRLRLAAVGVPAVLVAIGIAFVVGRSRRQEPPPVLAPPPPPEAAGAAPPPPPSPPPPRVPEPALGVEPVAAVRLKPPPARTKTLKRSQSQSRPGGPRPPSEESDVDSPLNPYAR